MRPNNLYVDNLLYKYLNRCVKHVYIWVNMCSRCVWYSVYFNSFCYCIWYHLTPWNLTPSSLPRLYEVMLSEMLQVLRGAGKVGSALVTTQGEQLRLMACNSSMAAGVKAAQDVVEGLVGTFTGGSSEVRILAMSLWALGTWCYGVIGRLIDDKLIDDKLNIPLCLVCSNSQ